MLYYYVGINTRSETHNYETLHGMLDHLRAEKVSRRIWMFAVEPEREATVFKMVRQCLRPDDEMMVAKVSSAMQPAQYPIAA